MPESRANKIERLFHAALEFPSGKRSTYLMEACKGDRSLVEEVEALIAAQRDTDDFLETPAWTLMFRPFEEEPSNQQQLEADPNLPFERLGEFRLIRQIGEGGMGVVYLAVQEPLGRQVALKLIRQEQMASPEIFTRFWREVETIAELRHPNIVTVYGCGKEKGICYFAMELVSGNGLNVVLNDATATGEKIPTSKILRWVNDLAGALDFVHNEGVIHRDIKPSNIRISSDDQAMLLDFGIARHMNLSTLTMTGQFRGTPHYASPEQIKAKRGEIDVRTDIYSLGVTLYEAVTGKVPFEGDTTEQLFYKILEEEPVPPRRLNPMLARDVETVILKAIEKEPDRRYRSMALFADDLRRLRSGEMILAKPAGLPTKLWNRVRRNPIVSAAVGVALLALVSLVLYILWSYPQILMERNEAKRQREAALSAKADAEMEIENNRVIIEFQEKMLRHANPEKTDKDLKVVDVLHQAAEQIDGSFPNQPEIEASLRHIIGNSYLGLGLYDQAAEQLSAAFDIRRRVLGEEHADTRSSMNNLAVAFRRCGKYAEAESIHRTYLEQSRRLLGNEDPKTIQSMSNLAIVLFEQGKLSEAEPILRRALDLRIQNEGNEHSETVRAMNNLAQLLQALGKLSEAESLFRKALDFQIRNQGEDHYETLNPLNNLACLCMTRGNLDESESLHKKCLDIKIRMFGETHMETVISMNNLATVYMKQGRLSQAEPLLRRVLEIQKPILGEEHPSYLIMQNNFAYVLLGQGKFAEAEILFSKVLEVLSRIFEEDHPHRLTAMNNLANVYCRQEKLSEAQALNQEALDLRIRKLGEEHPDTAHSMSDLATVFLRKDEEDKAESLLCKALDIQTRVLGDAHTDTLSSMHTLSTLYYRQGRYAEADRLASELLERTPTDSSKYEDRKELLDQIRKNLAKTKDS